MSQIQENYCWWEQKEDEEENRTKCAIDDKVGGRITPDTCNVWKKQGWENILKYVLPQVVGRFFTEERYFGNTAPYLQKKV